MDRLAGITLIELLAAMAIVAVLAGMAVPAFDGLVLNARRTATTESLVRAAWFARTEAVQRGRPVILCAAAAGDACAADLAAWSEGWVVTPVDEPGVVLRRGAGAAHPRARLLANRSAFHFEPHDRRSTNGTLAWCDARGRDAARAVVISATGRPRLERGAGSLECPAP
jgi:type IV fimbrial biogenesis protein FimT